MAAKNLDPADLLHVFRCIALHEASPWQHRMQTVYEAIDMTGSDYGGLGYLSEYLIRASYLHISRQ
jgi:hypothetical protein